MTSEACIVHIICDAFANAEKLRDLYLHKDLAESGHIKNTDSVWAKYNSMSPPSNYELMLYTCVDLIDDILEICNQSKVYGGYVTYAESVMFISKDWQTWIENK